MQVQIVKADGTVPATSGLGYLLESGETYYAMANLGERSLQSFQLIADDTIELASASVSDTNTSAPLNDVSAQWTPEKPPSAVIGTTASAGFNVTNATITKTAGTAGSAMIHVVDSGAARTRLEIVVGSAGGVLQIACHGKSR